MRMKLLFVTPTVDFSKESGGLQVTRERLEGLQSIFDVTVMTLGTESASQPLIKNHNFAGALRPRSAPGLLASYFRNLPISVWRNSPAQFIDLATKLGSEKWDVLYLDHWLVCEVAKYVQAKRTILHLHNAEPELFFRAASELGGISGAISFIEGMRTARYLRKIAAGLDELHLLSNADKTALAERRISHPNSKVFLPKVRDRPTATQTAPSGRKILFVGSLSWLPNSQGILWFATEVLPYLPDDLNATVAGSGASVETSEALGQHEQINQLGYVEDLDHHYATSRCLIAPLLAGSGIKIKIVNALSRGLPVVTTSVGAEGFPNDWGQALRVADDPAAFAKSVMEYVNDSVLWQKASANAIAYSQKYFSGAEWLKWCDEAAMQNGELK